VNKTATPAAAQNDALHFAPLFGGSQLKLQTTLKAVTPFAGLASFFAWLGQIGYAEQAAAAMPFAYRSPRALPLTHTLTAFLTSVLLGASRFAHSGWLRFDAALHALLGIERFPSDDAIRDFFHQFTQGRVEAFWRPMWRWLLVLLAPPTGGFTLDLDSTVFQRDGRQEGALKGYNPLRPGRKSHHPLLAVLAEAPFVLHAWLRSGNTTAGRGVVAFLREALAQLPRTLSGLRGVRADAGFFEPGLLAFLEEKALPYLIVARLQPGLKRRLHGLCGWTQTEDGVYAVTSFHLCLPGWEKERRFIVVRERVREDKAALGRTLLEVPGFTFRIWVTNRTEDPLTLWRDYNLRATVEQRIEELKNDLHADGFCAKAFFATEAAFLAVLFAYNLLAVYQAQVTPEHGYRQPSTLRAAVFVCGAILGRAGRQAVLRLSETWGGLAKHKPLIQKAVSSEKPITPLLEGPPGSAEREAILSMGGCAI
jgi:hypothetical protein